MDLKKVWVLCGPEKANCFFQAFGGHFQVSLFHRYADFFKEIRKVSPDLAFIHYSQECLDYIRELQSRNKALNLLLYSETESPDFIEMCYGVSPEGILIGDVSSALLKLKAQCIMRSKTRKSESDQILESLESELTPKEREILSEFFKGHDHSITRSELLESLWPNTHVGPKTIEVHISNIRKKIRLAGLEIVNLGNQGFRLQKLPVSVSIPHSSDVA